MGAVRPVQDNTDTLQSGRSSKGIKICIFVKLVHSNVSSQMAFDACPFVSLPIVFKKKKQKFFVGPQRLVLL